MELEGFAFRLREAAQEVGVRSLSGISRTRGGLIWHEINSDGTETRNTRSSTSRHVMSVTDPRGVLKYSTLRVEHFYNSSEIRGAVRRLEQREAGSYGENSHRQ